MSVVCLVCRTGAQWGTYGWQSLLSLQADAQARRGSRLLDNHGGRPHPGTLRGAARCLGALARDGVGIRRAAQLRGAQIDHVLAQELLLLRAPEEEGARGLRLSRARGDCAPDPARGPR